MVSDAELAAEQDGWIAEQVATIRQLVDAVTERAEYACACSKPGEEGRWETEMQDPAMAAMRPVATKLAAEGVSEEESVRRLRQVGLEWLLQWYRTCAE